MRKRLALALSALLLLAVFSGCGSAGNTVEESHAETPRIVTTIFPEYDWLRVLLGDNPGALQLADPLNTGVDLHSYQPSVDDILTIATCDLFVYVGGESDEWVEKVLNANANPDRIDICLLDVLTDRLREEKLTEGMEGEAEEDSFDEHVWLSLRNASVVCEALTDALEQLDPGNADYYRSNLKNYQIEFSDLDKDYQAMVSSSPSATLLFADRFPFRYLMEDYGLQYYAAFSGCSAETEASFETVAFLARKVDELGLPCVLTLESSDGSLAETVVQSTQTKDQQILTLDSLQSVDSGDFDTTYLSAMRKNLDVLTIALG